MAFFSAIGPLSAEFWVFALSSLHRRVNPQSPRETEMGVPRRPEAILARQLGEARNLYADCEVGFARSDPSKALICEFSRLRADAETNLSYVTVFKFNRKAARGTDSPE